MFPNSVGESSLTESQKSILAIVKKKNATMFDEVKDFISDLYGIEAEYVQDVQVLASIMQVLTLVCGQEASKQVQQVISEKPAVAQVQKCAEILCDSLKIA